MSKSKKTENLFVFSKSFNPLFNLAVEEYLTANIESNQVILYLWQNNNTVVIGSNQNPWKECDVGKIRENGIKLARRQSGGGAVFHDKGNLNFTFIAGNSIFNIDKQFTVILNAVNSFGLNAEFSGRNDILIDNIKFSGNAFFSNDNTSYHHGTLLIDSNLSTLSKILTPSQKKINSKGIDSVRARVTNLKKLSEEISVKKMYKIQSSWNWIYGDSPSFEAVHNQKIKWGEVEIGFKLIDGKITDTRVYSDSLVTTFPKKLSEVLKGVKYESTSIVKIIGSIDCLDSEKDIFSDIQDFFEQQCL